MPVLYKNEDPGEKIVGGYFGNNRELGKLIF
jgi:hypothetical protein